MTQLIKCTPCSMRLHEHPTIIKKMKTFLEVEGKMGPIPVPVPGNQFRPPLPETNPNVRKNDVTEKRKRATPKKKFRPATPKPTTVPPPLPEAPPKPKNNTPLPSIPVREDTHGLAQARCQESFSRTEIGYFLKTIWPLKTKVRMQPIFPVLNLLERRTQDRWTINH